MALPGKQDELVYALLEQTKRPENIIVVNQSGAAVEMPWADQASTILQAWYGGQEAGNALADVSPSSNVALGMSSNASRRWKTVVVRALHRAVLHDLNADLLAGTPRIEEPFWATSVHLAASV